MVAILGFDKNDITAAVREMYGAVASQPEGEFHFPLGAQTARTLGYTDAELASVPSDVKSRFAGVGHPFRAQAISPGDTVLDIGAGAGVDTIIAANRVGPEGHVHALDITPAMTERLRETVTRLGLTNVTVLEGDAESIPLADASVDVITSNGALNLVPDKRRAFAEMARVLKPGGRAQIADVVIDRPVPIGGRSDPALWAECVVGASIEEDYLDQFRQAGFAAVERLGEQDYFALSPSADTRRIASGLGARTIEIALTRKDSPAAQNERPHWPAWTPFAARALRPDRISSLGLWGAVGTVASLIACYGTLALVGMLAAMGLALPISDLVWALAIAVTAAVAAGAVAYNRRRHGATPPILLAAAGLALLLAVLFVHYNLALELVAFGLIIAGVVSDLVAIYRAECVPARDLQNTSQRFENADARK